VQVALSVRLYFRMRWHERVLVRLRRDFEEGGYGRSDIYSLPRNFSWIRWVLATFPVGATTPNGNFTRDDVLQELDARIASNPNYLLLQRMGVMAPLLGVILTVVGFYWLDVDQSEEQSLSSILHAVTPLVIGVGTGAVLAVVNQILLHGVGNRIEKLRLAARTWFDDVIWSQIGADAQAATEKAVAAIERLARSVAESADRHAAGSDRIAESTVAVQGAASHLRDVVQLFNAEIRGVPHALADLQQAIASSAAALTELIPAGSRAVANLDVSVAAFRTTVDREFAEAAKLHYRSSKVLAESVQQIGDATDLLRSGSDELKQTAEANSAAFARMDESLRQHVMPGNRHFHDSARALQDRVAELGRTVESLSAGVEAMAGEFDRVAGELVPSVSTFCEAVDNRFGAAVVQHGEQIESVGRAVEQLRESAKSLSEGTTVFQAMLRQSSQIVSQAASTQGALSDAADGLADAGQRLRRTVESDVAPSQRTMHDAAASFAESAAKFAELIDEGLGPAARQLAMLHQTLTGLEGAVASIRNFSHVRSDIDRLTASLARAAEIADAISSLPEQIRDILEQNADHHAALAASRGSFRNWLVGRPR
jgi:hypothetical protein